jgi:hypothetical protein
LVGWLGDWGVVDGWGSLRKGIWICVGERGGKGKGLSGWYIDLRDLRSWTRGNRMESE